MYGSGTALAAALGVTKQAVGSWDVDSNIPELQALKLLVLNPELFTDNWVLKAG